MNQTPNVTRKTGDCEGCERKATIVRLFHGKNQWYCDSCAETEIQRQVDMVRANQLKLSPVNEAVNESSKVDSSIQVRTDLFNAATQSILEIKQLIDSDESITNKPYALAETLMQRFSHFKQVVFELNQKIVEAGNQQKAIQVYLNQLSNTLRAEEREKLKINDINYKPQPVKVSSVKPTAVKSAVKKLDKVELRKYAAELGVSEFTLQMLVVQKGLSVKDAAELLKVSIASAKSPVTE